MKWTHGITLLFLLGGLFLALGFTGIIELPLFSKPEPPASSEAEKQEVLSPPLEISMNRKSSLGDPFSPPDMSPPVRKDGTERLAKIWSAMDVEALVKILEKWDDADALPVLARLEDKKLAELLAELPPERAATLSKGIKTMPKGGQK
ncbi:MAG TPA: hypothetical protein VNK96_03630 [Fimbriimonadales bacterium]|nr:hypothetical protein [Fimbriimonadales bacterium]